jgi:hypothetical protein
MKLIFFGFFVPRQWRRSRLTGGLETRPYEIVVQSFFTQLRIVPLLPLITPSESV